MDTEHAAEWAELLRAVAHPVRLMILGEMVDGPKCVTHIRELLAVRQPNVSQHLTILRHSGLVAFYRDGARRCYYLTRPALVKALLAFLGGGYPTVEPTRRAALRAMKRAREASTTATRKTSPRQA